jgi:ribosome-associated heat shock protein Hsp15
MRIDKFLFFARLTKTRSLAQSLLHNGHARMDGRKITSCSTPVTLGNVITLVLQDRVRVIQVEGLPARRGPATEAQSCYTALNLDLDPFPIKSARTDRTRNGLTLADDHSCPEQLRSRRDSRCLGNGLGDARSE